MHLTVLGLVLIPIALLGATQPVWLLRLAFISAVFEAGAALVLGGSFGLQPAMVPGLLFIAYVTLQYGLGMRYPGEAPVLWAAAPLIALLCYAVVSIWLLPSTFAGHVFVQPQRPDPLDPEVVVPLHFTFGNVTQTLYLALDVTFTVSVALFVTRASIPYEKIIAGYLLGGYIVVGLVFWQFANRVAGVPFPYDILQSNPGWAVVSQALGSVPRMQGPFSEPSALAGYMVGVTFCCLWLSIRGYNIMRQNILFALGLVTTLLSTSTTGIVTLVVGLPIVVAIATIGGDPRALGRMFKTLGWLVLAGSIAITPIFVLKPSLLASVGTVVESTLDKGQSDSYDERTQSDAIALATVAPTYGLGVGWGSDRSSSLIPGVLANGGVFGILMFSLLAFRVVALTRRGRAASPGHSGQILVDGFSASLFSQICTALISAPMISSLAFFLQLGCVIGVTARMVTEVKLRQKGRLGFERAMSRAPGLPTPGLARRRP
jgi:hypothetical protein